MGLDKFYTQKEVAKQCADFLKEKVSFSKGITFLEPSAGNGAFLDYLDNYLAIDIKPEDDRIKEQDFFDFSSNKKDYITIGNPPFGKRSKMAIDFFNKASEFSEIIAFIVPVSFMKWSVQKVLNKDFALINYFYLNPCSFLENGKPFEVRTVFQIWVKKSSQFYKGKDLRLKKSPSISHKDFLIWQYNATPEAIKYINEDWEIATYRQGYHDYNNLFYKEDYDYIKEKMTGQKKQQFFFIKPLTDTAREIILNMDFNLLAERNTSTPGFGKGDFVSYYEEMLEKTKNL